MILSSHKSSRFSDQFKIKIYLLVLTNNISLFLPLLLFEYKKRVLHMKRKQTKVIFIFLLLIKVVLLWKLKLLKYVCSDCIGFDPYYEPTCFKVASNWAISTQISK